ncbi:hypothetical protein BRADI_5g14777v3 [Brachypodium distachyon]|uniref:Uncharacterized protein n=1 Tax=Brachypodium distachyon TaxID=15368 RepID=A0A2K2CH78_BRADI|nr:hypothetical protein BRADI_5g14777v3 [Brachypodium distachyon]
MEYAASTTTPARSWAATTATQIQRCLLGRPRLDQPEPELPPPRSPSVGRLPHRRRPAPAADPQRCCHHPSPCASSHEEKSLERPPCLDEPDPGSSSPTPACGVQEGAPATSASAAAPRAAAGGPARRPCRRAHRSRYAMPPRAPPLQPPR